MSLQPITYVVWAMSFLSYVALAATMLHKGYSRRYPRLFALAIFEIALVIILFNLRDDAHYPQYFYTYWTAALVRSVLGFGVMYDVVKNLPGTRHIHSNVWRLFVVTSLLITIVFVWMSFERNQDTFRITAAVLSFNKGLYVAWGAFAISLFSQMGGISMGWTTLPLRIAIGFLASTLISLNCAYAMNRWPAYGFNIDQAASILLVTVWAYWALSMGNETTDPKHTQSPELLEVFRALLSLTSNPSEKDPLV